jgi:hypothetical protein
MEKKKIGTILRGVLFCYSIILCLILVAVGLYLAKTRSDFVNVFLFLPIPISLIFLVIKDFKNNKKIKEDSNGKIN